MASTLTALLTRIISLPFALVGLVLSRVLGVRRLPASLRLSAAWTDSDGAGSSASIADSDGVIVDPVSAAQWFLRYIKTCDPDPDGQGIDSSLWFTKGGYNAALRLAKEECQVLCVVLTSKEHDDNAAFMRQSLCTPAFKRLMQEHKGEIMFWGGDVCTSRDANIAATILQAATFPLVAFLSMQPLPPSRITGAASSTSSSKMTVFSRLEGLHATSVPPIEAHITETLAPRLNPFLGRLRAQKREREAQRQLREEQDRAYAEAGKRDMARVRAKEAELKAKEAKARLKGEAEERAKQEAAMKARESTNRTAWRRKTASEIGPEPADGPQLVIRLPDGRRLMRRFRDTEAAIRIWYYVEIEAFKATAHGNDSASAPEPGYKPHIAFSLATTFPRRLMIPDTCNGKTVGDLVASGLLDKKTTTVVVEGLSLSAGADDDDSDEELEED